MRKEITNTIKTEVAKYFHARRRAIFFELGLNKGGKLRADVFALSMRGEVSIVEVKSCLADFKADCKYMGYAEYCTQLYLAMPLEVYEKVKDTIPKTVGVFLYQQHGDRLERIRILPAKKRALDNKVLLNLTIRAAFRNSDKTSRKNLKFKP
jgi:hypothetical protein